MDAHQLLAMWLRDHANERRQQARRARASFEAMKDQTTPYARAIAALANAHTAAAGLYDQRCSAGIADGDTEEG
jgi:hypothetical protein